MLASIVASDELFRLNPGGGLRRGWALSFFLVETSLPSTCNICGDGLRRPF